TNISAGFDTLFFGIMLQIISKMNILKHRFQVTVAALSEIHDEKLYNIQDYKKIEDQFLTNWIKSHNAIISAVPICIIVYLISQMEIFTTKFMDLRLAMYNTQWFALSISAKRNITFMMMRTLKPVIFTSGYMVTLSLESFKS
ncbi:hypothetical protein PV327_011622, partial [Microctonus hyperodae]